jgi:hypothetical protein
LAVDEEDNLYFMGPSGLFIMPKGTTDVQNLSGNRLTSILNRVNTNTTLIELVYDSGRRTMMVFLTPRSGQSAGTHAAIEPAQKAFWKDVLPLRFGPLGVCKIDGESPDSRRFLIIGRDGFIRRPIVDRRDDDGDAIDAWVRFPVIETASGTRKIMAVEIQAVGSVGTGAVDWTVRADQSASQVLAQGVDDDGRAEGEWFTVKAGFQVPQRLRINDGAIQVQIRQTSGGESFSLERVVLKTKDGGPRRV